MSAKTPLKIEEGKLKQFNSSDFISPANKNGVVTLTDAATIVVDATSGDIFTVTLGGNRTLGNPTGAVNGQKLTFRIRQDATGSRTLVFDTKYRFPTGVTAITLSTSANATDYFDVVYHATDDKFDIIISNSGGGGGENDDFMLVNTFRSMFNY